MTIYKTRMKKVHRLFKVGNKKIGHDTLIFNFGTAKDCPSKKLGLCDFVNQVNAKRKGEKVCYACKMEWSKNVVNYREAQAEYWFNTPIESIIDDIREIVSKDSNIKFFRVNEANDLHSIEDVFKLARIANETGLRVYTYTHRSDIIDQLIELGYKLPKNLVINLSGFTREGYNSFTAVFKATWEDMVSKGDKTACKMDCTKCGLCKANTNKKISVPLH